MMNRLAIIILVILGLSGITWGVLSAQKKSSPSTAGKIKIAASFYPLAFLAERVGGNVVSVTSITPSGSEPHDYEPTPQEIITVERSKVFIYNGAGLDPWADRVKDEITSKGG